MCKLKSLFNCDNWMHGWRTSRVDYLAFIKSWISDNGQYIDAYVWKIKEKTYGVEITVDEKIAFFDDDIQNYDNIGKVMEFVDNNIVRIIAV